jgi:hypothetical protein
MLKSARARNYILNGVAIVRTLSSRAEYQFREAELMRSRGTLCWLLQLVPVPVRAFLRAPSWFKLLTIASTEANARRPHEQALSDTNKKILWIARSGMALTLGARREALGVIIFAPPYASFSRRGLLLKAEPEAPQFFQDHLDSFFD